MHRKYTLAKIKVEFQIKFVILISVHVFGFIICSYQNWVHLLHPRFAQGYYVRLCIHWSDIDHASCYNGNCLFCYHNLTLNSNLCSYNQSFSEGNKEQAFCPLSWASEYLLFCTNPTFKFQYPISLTMMWFYSTSRNCGNKGWRLW